MKILEDEIKKVGDYYIEVNYYRDPDRYCFYRLDITGGSLNKYVTIILKRYGYSRNQFVVECYSSSMTMARFPKTLREAKRLIYNFIMNDYASINL